MIRIQNLHYAYKKSAPLFEQLNFEAKAGSIYGLLGKNGAGKTTLLKLMSGLLFPHEGEIEVMQYRPRERPPELLRELYFLGEEFDIPAMRANAYKQRYAPFYPRFDHQAFDHYMQEFGLDGNQQLTALSFGQKKKVMIAFALATCCKLIIFDEPSNGMDIPSKAQFRKLLISAIGPDQTYIISTHQVRDLGALMDPVVVLDSGRILFHHDMERIARKLLFKVSMRGDPKGEALYEERVPGGYMVVSPNRGGQDSDPDIEVLFNALMTHPDEICDIMNKETVA